MKRMMLVISLAFAFFGCQTHVYNRSIVHVTNQQAETYGTITDSQKHGNGAVNAEKTNSVDLEGGENEGKGEESPR